MIADNAFGCAKTFARFARALRALIVTGTRLTGPSVERATVITGLTLVTMRSVSQVVLARLHTETGIWNTSTVTVTLTNRTFGEVPLIRWARDRAPAAGTAGTAGQAQTFSGARSVVAPTASGIRSAGGARRVEAAPFPAGLRGVASFVHRRPFATLSIREAGRIRVLVYAFGFVLTPNAIGFRAVAARRILDARTATRIHRQTLRLDCTI